MTCYHRTISIVSSEARFNLLSLMVVSPLYHFVVVLAQGWRNLREASVRGKEKDDDWERKKGGSRQESDGLE